MNKLLIETHDLKKYFNTPKGPLHAVDGINLYLRKGQTLGIVGESGCGKTTLGRSLLRLIEPTGGEILYDGSNIMNYNRHQMKAIRRKMQIIFQDPYSSINPRMTVSEIIAEPIRVSNVIKESKKVDDKVVNLMRTVGLADRFINTYPHELDGGRRQRIGIARALSVDPEFIVCDEPVSALDVSIQAQILNLLMDLQDERDLTYIFITHNLSVVKHISDNILVMYLGVPVEEASSEELFSSPKHPYTQALLNAIPVANLKRRSEKRIYLKGEVSNPINPKPGCRFLTRCPHASLECQEPQMFAEISPGHFVSCCKVKK